MLRKLRNYAPPTLLVIAFLALWEGLVRLLDVRVFILPAPSRIAVALWQWREALLVQHLPITLWEAVLGLVVAVVLAVLIAIPMHLVVPIRRSLYPLIVASQTIPTIAISTLIVVWFGYTLTEKVAVVVLWTFFPVAVATMDGLQSASRELLDWMQAAGASRWQIFRLVQLPAALPSFFTGLKLAAAYSISGAVFGEYLGGSEGLGVFGRRAASTLKMPEVFASVVVLAVVGVALFQLGGLLERRFLRHRQAAR